MGIGTLHTAVALLDLFMDSHKLRCDRLSHVALSCLSLAGEFMIIFFFKISGNYSCTYKVWSISPLTLNFYLNIKYRNRHNNQHICVQIFYYFYIHSYHNTCCFWKGKHTLLDRYLTHFRSFLYIHIIFYTYVTIFCIVFVLS